MTGTIHQKIQGLLVTKKRIQCKLFVDFGANYQDSIFLSGTGRSGTTWISNIINYNNTYRYLFEPFYPAKVSICSNFTYKQYLRPDNRDPDYLKPAQLILTGKIRNDWIDGHNKKMITRKRLIKDIRTNFLLRWLYINFPGLKIIFAMRHPCAVANSRMRLNWKTHFNEFIYNKELLEDFLNPYIDEIEKAESDFERHIFLWCVENYVPLKQFKKDEIFIAFYENYCENPRDEIHRLFSFLNIKYDDYIFNKLNIPSHTSRVDSAPNKGLSLIDNWRKHTTREQIQRAIDILSLFGLDTIYTDVSMPNTDNVYYFMRGN